jgi:hypothetical protein
MRVVEHSRNGLGKNEKQNIIRVIYSRLNGIYANLIGELKEDGEDLFLDFLKAFNDKEEGEEIDDKYQEIDAYLGSLGVDRNYGHKDINYVRGI